MAERVRPDCVVIGYNETPFEQYECFLSKYGEDTEAYRDLKFSFVDLGERKLDYVGLLNHALAQSRVGGGPPDRRGEFKSGEIPNLAAVYLTNYLRKLGFGAEYINLFQYEKERLVELLAAGPLAVAITTTFYVINQPVNEVVSFIREHNEKVKIVVGGPLIANHARNYQGDGLRAALDDIGADFYVVEGAGEATLGRLLGCLKRGGDWGEVANLVYIEQGKLRRTPAVVENNSLDEGAIDWTDFAGEPLGATIQTRTARSCAFNCSFCNYPTRAGKLTLASLDTVRRELDSMRRLETVENVVFIDDTFNVPLPRFKDLCRMMIKDEYAFNWFSYFRCSNSDPEAIELMARSGCKGVFLGIESGSPKILKHMNKAATIEKYVEGMRLLHEHGILTFASFIIGFPGETEATVAETSDFIKATRPDFYRAQSWYCEPGTPIDSQREKFGIDGNGFVWLHSSMDSLTAMDHIERLFLSVNESQWLPQWSFDFWIIPYLLGKGVSLGRFREFMATANKLLALEIACLPGEQKAALQQASLRELTDMVRGWA